MIRAFSRFVAELRRSGLTVSPAEWLDAMCALRAVGLEDRSVVRAALRSTLAKRHDALAPFDEVFDRFFVVPSPVRVQGGRGARAGGGGSGQAARRGGRPQQGSPPSPRPLLGGHPQRERRVSPTALLHALELRKRATGEGERSERARAASPQPTSRLRRVVLERDDGASRSTRGPRQTQASDRRDLRDRWSKSEEQQLAVEMVRIVRSLRLGTSRRQRRARRGGHDLRRLFRENLGLEGVPWILPRRRARSRTASIVLLVDVSWSAARAAGLFLSFAAELLQKQSRVRALFFVDAVLDATDALMGWCAQPIVAPRSAAQRRPSHREHPAPPGDGVQRGGRSFARLLLDLRGLNLDAPSDYGRAFHALLRSPLCPGGRRTALVVLGDGRTNRFDPQAWAFEEIAARCGAVLWLVPEPEVRWGTGDSALAAYLPHADAAFEARDLRGLEAGVRELARRIRA